MHICIAPKKEIILPFYNRKGSRTDCRNYLHYFQCQARSMVMCYLTVSKHTFTISAVPNRVVLHLTDQPSIVLLHLTCFYRQNVDTENHIGWRTSIFDQLSTLLTDSPCGCFFDPRVFQRRYSASRGSQPSVVSGWMENYLHGLRPPPEFDRAVLAYSS